MTHTIPVIVLALLAGPLLAAAAAKLLLPAARLDWPQESLRVPVGPRLAAAGELAVAVVLVTAPARAAAIAGAVCYATLTAAAWRLRGQRCACFGVARIAAVGPAHLALNCAATVIALVVTVTGGTLAMGIRPVVAVAGAAATAGLLTFPGRFGGRRFGGRRFGGRGSEEELPCGEQIGGVRLYVSESCPACRALQTLLAGVEPARRAAVQILDRQASPPSGEAARLGIPCAVPLSMTGEPACAPVSGVDPVWRLIQRVTISVGQPR